MLVRSGLNKKRRIQMLGKLRRVFLTNIHGKHQKMILIEKNKRKKYLTKRGRPYMSELLRIQALDVKVEIRIHYLLLFFHERICRKLEPSGFPAA